MRASDPVRAGSAEKGTPHLGDAQLRWLSCGQHRVQRSTAFHEKDRPDEGDMIHVNATGAGRRQRLLTRTTRAGSAVIAAGALVLTGIALPATAAPPAPGTIGVEQDLAGGSYIVTLVDDAVATYEGGVPGYEGTAPEEGDQLNARLAPVQEYSE